MSSRPPGSDQPFLKAEHLVEQQSAELKKELRLSDLVLSQLAYIVGLAWIGSAAKLGAAHIMFWIPAVVLFYIPSGIVVVHLNREMPLEGGLYQWAKLRFGDLAGFLVGVNIWATMILLLAASAANITNALAYSVGASVAENKTLTMAIGTALMAALLFLALRGLALSKWLHNVGGFAVIPLLAAMIFFALPRWLHGGAVVAPFAFSFPAISVVNLSILGRMGFGAFCGFDGCAIFSGEVHDPRVARMIRRSVWLSAPLIALIYVIGAACLLAFVSPGDIDLINPAIQVLNLGARTSSNEQFVVPLAVFLALCNTVGQASIYYNAVIRLPMVAGWDHLLPAWISRLHPRYKTPAGSIVAIALLAFLLMLLGTLDAGSQESYQLLVTAGIICWSLTYVVMFAIPLVAPVERPPLDVRIAAVSGLAMTLLYAIFAVFPIIDVQNPAIYSAKIAGVIIAINAAGAWYFRLANRRRCFDVPT